MTFTDNRIYTGNVFHDNFNHVDFEVDLVLVNRVSVYLEDRLAVIYIGYSHLVTGIANGRYKLISDMR